MQFLKTYFPFSFRPIDTRAFILTIVIYVVLGTVISSVIRVLSYLWLIGWIFRILGSLLDLYMLVGIILTILRFAGLIR